jgi:serine/threonine protein kinase
MIDVLIYRQHNVLIDDNKVARLCDFGRSKIVDHRGYTTVFSGTVRRLAPELLSVPPEGEEDDDDIPEPVPAPLTKKSDIFGFAMVALEVCDVTDLF